MFTALEEPCHPGEAAGGSRPQRAFAPPDRLSEIVHRTQIQRARPWPVTRSELVTAGLRGPTNATRARPPVPGGRSLVVRVVHAGYVDTRRRRASSSHGNSHAIDQVSRAALQLQPSPVTSPACSPAHPRCSRDRRVRCPVAVGAIGATGGRGVARGRVALVIVGARGVVVVADAVRSRCRDRRQQPSARPARPWSASSSSTLLRRRLPATSSAPRPACVGAELGERDARVEEARSRGRCSAFRPATRTPQHRAHRCRVDVG